MAVDEIQAMRQAYRHTADFIYVYISEAHAGDEWPLGFHLRPPQPKTDAERLSMARLFVKDELCNDTPVCVDSLELGNPFDKQYAVWPERFFVVVDGVLELVGKPTTEFGYDRDDIARFLENHRDAVQAAASSPDASPEQADPAIPRPTAIAVHTSSAVATNEHEQNEVSVQSLTIVVVGENGSGSTELIHRYAFDSIPEKETACDLTPQASTSGCSDGISDGDSSRQSAFAKRVEKTVVQCHVSATSHRVQLEIWDLPGTPSSQHLARWNAVLREASAMMVTLNPTDQSSIDVAKLWVAASARIGVGNSSATTLPLCVAVCCRNHGHMDEVSCETLLQALQSESLRPPLPPGKPLRMELPIHKFFVDHSGSRFCIVDAFARLARKADEASRAAVLHLAAPAVVSALRQ
eukprot:INCI5372.2.p1 GENE.INCI5372.2~~INCI5372.2.p1  ORF type:complete len:409 (-),score=69.37 INCI5372.2:262-1488(-)